MRKSLFAVLCLAVGCSSASNGSTPEPPTATGTDAGTGDQDGGGATTSGDDAGGSDAAIAPFGTIGVSLSTATVTVKQGRSVTLDVTITRPDGVTDAVDLDVNGLPPAATAKTVHVASGETKGTIEIDAADVTPQGTSTASVVATSGTRSDGVAALQIVVIGRPGTLDTSYGIGGRSLVDIPPFGYGSGLTLQQNGAALFAASGQLVRLGLDGKHDATFGTAGVVGLGGNWFFSAAVDYANRPVIGYRNNSGGSGSTAGVARYTVNGAADTSFASTGSETITWTSPISEFDDNVSSVGLEPDGRMVVAGDRATSQSGFYVYSRISIIRLLENGTVDPTFTRWDAPYDSYSPHVARTPDGKWVVASQSGQLFRLNGDGTLDTGFHSGTPASAVGTSLVVLADGSILNAGGSTIAKFTSAGDLDATFGTAGKFTVPAGGPGIAAIALQSDGAIVATGGANADFSTIRVLANGTIDTDFGTNGIAQTDIRSVDDSASGVGIQPDGKIVVGGTSGGKGAVVRYWP